MYLSGTSATDCGLTMLMSFCPEYYRFLTSIPVKVRAFLHNFVI
jgi:hypothetical protein